jgi:hypothetical protein
MYRTNVSFVEYRYNTSLFRNHLKTYAQFQTEQKQSAWDFFNFLISTLESEIMSGTTNEKQPDPVDYSTIFNNQCPPDLLFNTKDAFDGEKRY